MTRHVGWSLAAAGLLWAVSVPIAGQAQEGDGSRAVRIIESAPTGAPPASLLTTPAAEPVDVRQVAIKADNPAGMTLSILPDVELAVGMKVTFRVSTRTQGYLILVDVDPTGKLNQIYPNKHSLQTLESRESLNLVKAGQTITIPNQQNPFAGFEFVASPPTGIAMVVAILSDRPVHLLDLPDVAPPRSGQVAFDQLHEVARRLRIARADGPGDLQVPNWSFDAKLYVVR